MPFSGTGIYSPPAADFPAVTLTTIGSVHFNNTVTDMSTGLSNCVTRDGQSTWTGNLPAGGFKITGMAAGTLRTDSVRAAEAQDGGYVWGGTAGGTADALTFTLTPAITAYAAGQVFRFKAGAAANTGAATLAINGLTTKAIQLNGIALLAGDIAANGWYTVLYDGAAFQLQSMAPQFTTAALTTGMFSTGDVKITIKTVADIGWVLMNDTTIGNGASGATGRANADTVSLYTLLYNNTVDADCAVSGGRGASAAADYAANKTIALPKALGRALATFGTGAGLTARTMAKTFGTENHPLIAAEGPPHTHTMTWPSSFYHGNYNLVNADTGTGGTSGSFYTPLAATNSSGSGTAHNNMQPTLFLNVMIKL